MSSLSNQQQNLSFQGILQVPGGVTSELQTVQDGNGNPTGLQISSTGINVSAVVETPVTVEGTVIPNSIERLISDRFGEHLSVLDFGALGNGVHDDTTAINNALTALKNLNGGTLYFPPGTYKVTNVFTIGSPNINIVGAGSQSIHDAGAENYAPATSIVYSGITSSTSYLFNFVTPPNVNSCVCFGGGMQDIFMECNALLAGGVQVISWRSATFTNLNVYNPTVYAYRISCWKTGVEVPEAADTQRCIFTNCSLRAIDSVAVQNAVGFLLTSEYYPTSNANTSFNSFLYCGGQSYQAGFILYDADNNNFTSCGGGGLASSSTICLQLWADSNYFYDFSAGGLPSRIKVYGTASGNSYNPSYNCFIFADLGNGTEPPQLDAGCRIFYNDSSGVTYIDRSAKAIIADNSPICNSYYSTIGNCSLIVANGSQNSMQITDGISNWGLAIADDSSLRFTCLTGASPTTNFRLGNGIPVLIGGNATINGTTTTVGAANLTGTNTLSSNTTIGSGAKVGITTNLSFLGAGDYTSTNAFTIPIFESLGSRNDSNTTFQGRFGAAYRRTDGNAITTGNFLGTLGFGGQWGTSSTYTAANLLYPASIAGVAEGTFTAANAMPTGISFLTGSTGGLLTQPNTSYGTEKLRIQNDGVVRPGADNTQSIGSASYRWSVVYAGTGTINTSDERTKQQIKPIDEAVLRAWGKVEYSQFKFNDAVEAKGDGSRWHIGLIAQKVKEAFESEGLNAFEYGLLCYDEWEEITEEVTIEEPYTETETYTEYEKYVEEEVLPDGKGGEVTKPIEKYKEVEKTREIHSVKLVPTGETKVVRVAGNRYGIRYEEALALECAYLRSKIA